MFATVETDFGLFLLREAPANEPLVVSPLSVIFALAMVQAGARVTTKNQINKVISKGAFALIVNAIYFTAEWSVKFDQSSNSKRKFFSAENSEKELEFMNNVDYKLYVEDADLLLLSLQYKDTSYAFNILLPKKRFGLGEVLKTMDGEKVQNLLSKLKETYVSVPFPHFIF
ncbi:hypothetical protein ANCCAN_26480 [Ancylostoma caninum]|uniref:Serpin domain-containing protein n=1 Tax=Ancylostoma caninum TaxID=29170 RepID=A0A368F6T7_ANCCA|nr:hypothetical protein ANCCAN_26480 [Ancylostoma caninum]